MRNSIRWWATWAADLLLLPMWTFVFLVLLVPVIGASVLGRLFPTPDPFDAGDDGHP
jgi:hypothetical protein